MKCECGGFISVDDLYSASGVRSDNQRTHNKVYVQKILDNEENSEWLRFCDACETFYCRGCRLGAPLSSALSLSTRSQDRWILGIPDGSK